MCETSLLIRTITMSCFEMQISQKQETFLLAFFVIVRFWELKEF